jgi:hypothetical protein
MINLEYKHWNEYWVNTKNSPIYQNPPAEAYGGTNYEPLASIGMSCFTDAVRDNFKENFSIIDYKLISHRSIKLKSIICNH